MVVGVVRMMAKVQGGCIVRGGPVCLILVSISVSSNIDLTLIPS